MVSEVVIGSAPTGAGFSLGGTVLTDAQVALTSGWTAEVLAGTQTIVARGPQASGYEIALDAGLNAAQEALDVFCIRGTLSLAVVRVEATHFAWWTDSARTIMRVVGVVDRNVGMTATLSVVDSHGNPKPVPPLPVVWHESFRYFRVSQTSTDLFDAYRNLYLALESILTTMVPVLQLSNGRSEPESSWLKRALRKIHRETLPLARYAPPGSIDPPAAIYQDVYAQTRTAIFHAKQGRRALLPQHPGTRAGVVDTLERLSRLYLDFVDKALGVRRAAGVMTLGGFNLAMQPLIDVTSEMAISDDDSPLDRADTAVNPGGGSVAQFAAAYDPALDRPGYKYWLGELHSARFGPVQRVSRLGLLHHSILTQAKRLDDPVSLSGIDVLQVQLGQRLVNTNHPRATFAT
jgi:hypothetical protein